MTDEIPVACTLGAEGLRCHADELLPGLATVASAVVAIEGGYRLTFDPTTALMQRITGVIERERHCCAFLTFRLEVPAGKAPLALSITGAGGAASFLRDLLGGRLTTPSG